MMGKNVITTERLLMREYEDDDRELVYRFIDEFSLLSELKKDEEFITAYRQAYLELITDQSIFNGMIFLKETLEFIGMISIQNKENPFPELGIDILGEYQNCGYGPEAIAGFCNWYSTKYSLNEVKVLIRKDNTHSIHIFEKIGAEFIKFTSSASEALLAVLEEIFTEEELAALPQDSIREYILHLPVKQSLTI